MGHNACCLLENSWKETKKGKNISFLNSPIYIYDFPPAICCHCTFWLIIRKLCAWVLCFAPLKCKVISLSQKSKRKQKCNCHLEFCFKARHGGRLHCIQGNVLSMRKTWNFWCKISRPILKLKLWFWCQNKDNKKAEGSVDLEF